MKEMNPEVPIEATFKWLCKENERLRRRELLLTEYAKALEDYTKRLAENEKKILADNSRLYRQAEQLAGTGLTVKQRRRVISMMKQALNLLEQGWAPEEDEEEEL